MIIDAVHFFLFIDFVYSTVRTTGVGCKENGKGDVEITQPNGSNQQKSKQNARTKHKCPFPSCSAEVIHLPRHMRQRHQWDIQRMLAKFLIRLVSVKDIALPVQRRSHAKVCFARFMVVHQS